MIDVELTPDAAEELHRLPKAARARVYGIVERLKAWPNVSGIKPLSHGLSGRFRIRTGDYRVRFRVEGQAIVIDKIGHRDRFYED